MSRWTQFRQALEQPAYRTKLAFFLLLGITATLVAILLPPNSLGREILLDFAVTLGAVGILQLVWDFLGGDPTGLQIKEVLDEITGATQSVTLLSDLVDGNIGIERIWPERKTWEPDPKDGLAAWRARVCQAKRVDIMSNTLWNNWMKEAKFRKRLLFHIAQGTVVVRILIYDPDSKAFDMRAQDEAEWRMQRHIQADAMKLEIANTLRSVQDIQGNLPESVRENLQVCLTHQTLQLCQTIRADEQMLIAIYLSGETGGPCPTMQLRDPQSTYFAKYQKQFETMWERGKPLSDKDLNRILDRV